MPDPVAFTPVPLRARRDGWTPARQRAFVAALADTRHVARAAASVGMTPKSAYRLRGRAEAGEFARAWDSALTFAPHPDERVTAAIEGVVEPVFYRGLQVGERRRYDDAKLCRLLRAAYSVRRISGDA